MCFLSFFISQCNLLVWFPFTDTAEGDSARTDTAHSADAAQFSNSRLHSLTQPTDQSCVLMGYSCFLITEGRQNFWGVKLRQSESE